MDLNWIYYNCILNSNTEIMFTVRLLTDKVKSVTNVKGVIQPNLLSNQR